MSLSRETIEQLLSGYMDDALSDSERGQFEELLRTDPVVADELNELRRIRESLQFIARADSTVQLKPGFADRVLDAAVQRARAEGLREDHPVVRLSEQPSPASSARSNNGFAPALRWVGIAAALAASVAIAFVFWSPTQSTETNTHSLANVDSVPDSSESDSPAIETAIVANDLPNDLPDNAIIESSQPDRLANSTKSNVDPVTNESASPTKVDDNVLANSSITPKGGEPKRSMTPNVAKTTTTKIASAPQRMVGAVMVLEISRTEAGRMSRAVRRAMNAAEIKIQNEKLIAEDIVSVLDRSDREDEDSLETASVLYLEGTARQLDRFILSLCSDERGIETIRFGLASELPILNLLQKLQRPIDPKTVRHSASWTVQGQSAQASRLLSETLIDRTMVPLASNVAAMGVIPVAREDGPDVMSELFVVVR